MKNGDFLKKNLHSKQDYLVDGLIPHGQTVVVAGLPGEGKTLFALSFGYHISYGASFLGRNVQRGSFLLLDNENPKSDLVQRIMKIKNGLEIAGYTDREEIDIQHYSGFMLDDRNTWDEVKSVVNEIHPAVIVIDHLRAFHGQQEDKSTGMQQVAQAITDLCNLCGSTVLVLHHFGKGGGNFYKRLRGSSVIYAKSEAALEVRALSRKEGKLESIGVIPQHRKGVTPKPFRVVIEDTNEYLMLKDAGEYRPVDDPVGDNIAHRCCHIILGENSDMTVNNFKAKLGGLGSDEQVRKACRTLENRNIVKVTPEGKNHIYVHKSISRVCPWCGKYVFSDDPKKIVSKHTKGGL